MIKPGVLLNGDYRNVLPFDQDKIREFVTSSWYRYTEGRDAGLAPYDGETNAYYNGPRPPYKWLSDHPQYTWVKAPRYDGHAMAVGPNARMMIGYAQGVPAIVERVDAACDKLGLPRDNAFMNSTLGRVYGRALDALINVDMMVDQLQEMTDRIRNGETSTFNPENGNRKPGPPPARAWAGWKRPAAA